MRIRRKFLQLTSQTVPYGTEVKIRKYLPKGVNQDEHGNYFITIGESFTTMFTCHLDTACRYQKRVNHTQTDTLIGTDGTTILGADDKAGLTVLLYMIEKKVPGLYYFFIGEEVGCIGSSKLASTFDWSDITKVVSFDRRGTTSIITEQLYGRCCSDEFANSLAEALNSTGMSLEMEPDDTGILTDSAQFVEIVPECTNISVGYYNEHTVNEIQDIEFLARLCQACVKIDWESLPIVRIPGEDDDFNDSPGWDDEESVESVWESTSGKYVSEEYTESVFTYISENGVTKKMYISKTWIEHESKLIKDMLKSKGYQPTSIVWDGTVCYCQELNGPYDCVGNRQDLINFISDLAHIPYSHLKENINRVDKNYENWTKITEYAN